MSNNKIFRIAGVAGILTVVYWLALMGVSSAIKVSPVFFVVASLLSLPFVFGLYIFYRGGSPGLALGAAILNVIGLILSTFGDPTVPSGTTMYGIGSVFYGLGIALFGWLAYGRKTRVLGIIAIIGGLLALLTGIAFLAGSARFGNLLNYGSTIPITVWMVWLSVILLSGKITSRGGQSRV